MRAMNHKTIEQTVGNTPLVRLQRMPGETSNTLLVKLEGIGHVPQFEAFEDYIKALSRFLGHLNQ